MLAMVLPFLQLAKQISQPKRASLDLFHHPTPECLKNGKPYLKTNKKEQKQQPIICLELDTPHISLLASIRSALQISLLSIIERLSNLLGAPTTGTCVPTHIPSPQPSLSFLCGTFIAVSSSKSPGNRTYSGQMKFYKSKKLSKIETNQRWDNLFIAVAQIILTSSLS